MNNGSYLVAVLNIGNDDSMERLEGRQLDAEVHKRIFGLQVTWINSNPYLENSGSRIYNMRPVPYYSSDMRQVWPVLDLMSQSGRIAAGASTHFALWWRETELWRQTEAAAATAICLAALAALEH